MKFLLVILVIPISLLTSPVKAQKPAKTDTAGQKKDKDDPAIVLPVLVRGPYLQRATPTSMLIRWRTDALCRSRVYFGNDPDALKNEVTDSALVTEHKILLGSLNPKTRYYASQIGYQREISCHHDTRPIYFCYYDRRIG